MGKRSVEIVGEAHGMNYKKVMRYLRLNHLVPELMDKVDDKKMGFMPAVELSYIKPKNQRLIAVSIDGEQASPSLAQAKQLRELDKEGKLNGDVIDGIDDLGVERSTEYAMEQMFFVIDSRYRSRRPMIITTNLKLAELKNPPDLAHARIYDRILERCAPILFAGKNFREENAGATKQAAKDIVNRKSD